MGILNFNNFDRKENQMKRHQTGEAMLAVMVVMLAIALFSRGHMGMM